MPLLIVQYFPRLAHHHTIYQETQIRRDGRDIAEDQGRRDGDHVYREFVERILTNIHFFAKKQARVVAGVHDHHVTIRVGAVVFDVDPIIGGKPSPGGGIVGDGVIAVVGRRAGLVLVAGGKARVVGQHIGYTLSEIAVGEDVFAQIARAGTEAGRHDKRVVLGENKFVNAEEEEEKEACIPHGSSFSAKVKVGWLLLPGMRRSAKKKARSPRQGTG